MPRPIKTREMVATQFYLNTSDIMVLIGCGWYNAKRLFNKANEVDDKELPFRVEPLKVRTQTVIKLAGISQRQLDRIVQGTKKEIQL